MTIEKYERKKELKDKVAYLVKTVHEIKPRNRQESLAAVERMIYMANTHQLKEFVMDRNCEGEKPRLMVESPYTDPNTGLIEDRIYMPYNEPMYHQHMLDMLKKQQLVPYDSKLDDYDFLFNGCKAEG
jgi:hypothetical protein